jgi:arginine deiminase
MEMGSDKSFTAAAYGGEGWEPRTRAHGAEIGSLWAPCGQDSEWAPLRSVLLYRPGRELTAGNDFNAALQLAPLDLPLAQQEHDKLVGAYRSAGVSVHLVDARGEARPNQMFCADLVFMTREGAILARPASAQRAGEERHVAASLATLGIPILRTLTGHAVFEGADAMWIDKATVVIGRGLRTNDAAIAQITSVLGETGVKVLTVDMPFGTMHLMGMFRMVDRDLAICWPRRTPHALVSALLGRGIAVVHLPDGLGDERGAAMNFVTLGPRRILMVEECRAARTLYESHGVTCLTTPCRELSKAAGAVGCLSAVLHRDPA